MTIFSLWKESLTRFQDYPFLSTWDPSGNQQETWTYGDTQKRIEALGLLFNTWCLDAGDRVGLWSGNKPAWGGCYLSTALHSLVAVPLLPDLTVKDALVNLKHAEAKVLILGSCQYAALTDWIENPVDPVCKELSDFAKTLRLELIDDIFTKALGLVNSKNAASYFPEPKAHDLAAILYTSGTTGNAKGVMLTHENIASNVCSSSKIPGLVPGERMLSVLPLAHTYECSLGFLVPMREGANIFYLTKTPSPTILLSALKVVRPHAMLTVPIFMEKIYKQKVLATVNQGMIRHLRKIPGLGYAILRIAGAKLKKTFGGRIKFFGVGGAPLSSEVEKFLYTVRFNYAIGYGLTETAPLIAGALKGTLYSTGPVLPGVQVKIGPHSEGQCAGEILVKGPNVMAGYYKDPERTAAAFTEDGWFKTGDLGVMGKKHLYIKGRSKNLILGPNGENIYPEAIEELINRSKLVNESLVIQRGKKLVAKVVWNREALQESFKAWALKHEKEWNQKSREWSMKSQEWMDSMNEYLSKYLKELLDEVNGQLARFSRIAEVETQEVPFEKTATLKIKRFMYA